nr:hypothetical protein BaRGS_000576 [Batillaria attramentaria]
MADEEEKENFYEQLQAVLDKSPRRDLKILMGDLNAKVGTDNTDRELIMGKHGTGTQNENGELFTEFCTTNDLVIGGTIFPHKTIHKTTWTSPDGRTVNQIDHITIGRKWRRSLLDVRAKRGADAASDHHLVIAAIKIKLKAYRDQADRPSHKYNVHSLKESVKTNAFRYHNRDLQAQYWDVNRQVKRSARNDKRNFINDLTEEAETAAGQRNMKRLYEITRTLSGKNNNPTRPVKDKKRTNHHQRGRPKDKTEIIKAIKSLKSGKAAGPDGIPPEALKADIQTSTDMLHPLLREDLESESVPQDWKKGHLDHPGEAEDRAGTRTLREEQAGFRNDRSCTDHIATMRIIIEQSLEWQTPLYSTFVDFQKAFDSVDRELHQEDIKEVDKFIYLGSVVSKDGGTDEDIKSRTNKARHAFSHSAPPVWRSTALSLRNKIRIFNSNVKSVLLYGSETWRTTKTGSHRLQTFINRCLRNILNIRYPLVITNQDLWERTRQVPIEQEIKKRKWGWIGHTLRKPTSNVTRQSLDWNPQGKRKVGPTEADLAEEYGR